MEECVVFLGRVQIQGREMTGERERGRESNRTAAAAELWLHVAGLRYQQQ